MKQHIIKTAIFIVTFFISLVIMSSLMNKGNTDMTVEMSPPSYPVINMRLEGLDVNTLYGYTDVRDEYLRDTLTPIRSDKKLSMVINTFDARVEGVSIEVRSCDAQRLVEKTDIYNYITGDGIITADFGIKDLIEAGKEYILIIILDVPGQGEIHYSTRIREDDETDIRAQLEFVKDFHERTFDKEEARSLVTYLESNEEGDNSTYSHVNIHSSFNQVTWGDLNIKHVSDGALQIYQMDSSLADIGISYEVDIAGDTSEDEDEEPVILATGRGKKETEDERYLVREFYRIRYTPDRIYLLAYDRWMNRIFDESGSFVNDKIVLGITDGEVELFENNEGNIVVFEQSGALYEYMNSEGTLARLFSFYDEEALDIRAMNGNHRIKVLSVDETGNVFFMVYGYMNRGRHEGRIGACVFYYDNSRNYIEEKIYIPYDRSWGMLCEDIERLAYINKNNYLYVYLNGAIYCGVLDSGETSVLEKDFKEEYLVTSRSNQIAALGDEERKRIKLVDLGSSKTRIIRAGSGERICPIGFLGDDLVYGISGENDLTVSGSSLSNGDMLLDTIKIEDKSGTLLKTYHEDGVYITSADIGGSTLHMKRVRDEAGDGILRPINDDQIMDNEVEAEKKNKVVYAITQSRERVAQIALTANVSSQVMLHVPKEVLIEGGSVMQMSDDEQDGEDIYYVYGEGLYQGSYPGVARAVAEASGINGVVLDKDMQYVWQKGNRAVRCEIKDIDIEELLQGGEGSVNLTGCTLDEVLYYVSNETPVLSYTGGNVAVIIAGYDEKNTILMDPVTGARYKKGMNDSREWFKENGNRFFTRFYSD